MYSIRKNEINDQLSERITQLELLTETSCSWIYYLKGKKEYILKKAKSDNISKEFENHKLIYQLWKNDEQKFDFKIPYPYSINEKDVFYIMDYVSNSVSLQKVLQQKNPPAEKIFQKAGKCCKQLHRLIADCFSKNRQSLCNHKMVRDVLKNSDSEKIKRFFDSFEPKDYQVIIEDLKPSNMLLDINQDLYFIDFQPVYYYWPYYYDLARFVDTAKLFSFLRNPIHFGLNFKYIDNALLYFIKGYEQNLDEEKLKKMQYIHRKFHIERKLQNSGLLDATALKIIYTLIIRK